MTAIVIAACTAAPVELELPHHNVPPAGVGGVATGGIVRTDGRCVWLESATGSANLIWPVGYRAVSPPLSVVSPSGRVVLHAGDLVELGVTDARQAVPGCPGRGVFLVGEISVVNGVEAPREGAPQPPRTPASRIR